VSGGGGKGGILNNSNIDAVLNKRQPGDSPRKTKQQLKMKLQEFSFTVGDFNSLG